MKINKNLTPYNRWEGRRGDRVEWIVVHYTANTWQPDLAKNECAAFASEYKGASAHFFVDKTEIWQSVAVEDTAWHCGDAPSKNGCRNTNSIGIEMCVVYEDGVYSIPKATVRRAAALVAELLTVYPDAKICRHYDVTGKKCPAPWVDDPALWDEFLKKVEESREMNETEKRNFASLSARVAELEAKVKAGEEADRVMSGDLRRIDGRTKVRYDRVSDCPPWMRPTIRKLVDKGFLKGDQNGSLGLTQDAARVLTVCDRTGIFGE